MPRTSRRSMPIQIRPIRPDDAACLSDAWARSSPDSRRRRMNGTLARLRPAELRYLTEVDHHDHEAVVALDTETGRLIGVMRYIRLPGCPRDAELAALVVDDWQRHGVARALLAALAEHARADGVTHFHAVVAPENTPAIAALRRLEAHMTSREGEVHFRFPVPRRDVPDAKIEPLPPGISGSQRSARSVAALAKTGSKSRTG